MASLPKPTQVRRLCDLLQEQQEPFLLDQYLLEKGYSKKNLKSRRGTSYSLKKRREGIPKCSKLLRSVFSKFVSGKNRKSLDFGIKPSADERSSGSNCNSVMGRKTQWAEPNRISSASSMTVYDSCSDSEFDESISALPNPVLPSQHAIRSQQASTDRKQLQFGFHEDCKQLSPVSVLELPSHERSPVHKHMQFCTRRRKEEKPSTSSNCNLRKIVTEDSILSASLWETLANSLRDKQVIEVEELDELVGSVSSSQYMRTVRVLQQTKQLLFDCVREVVEIHEKKRRRRPGHGFLGSENLGIIICDHVCSWVKQSGDITNTIQLIGLDFSRSTEEWSHFQPHIREIGFEIGEAIFEDIKDEIVSDMIDFLASKRC